MRLRNHNFLNQTSWASRTPATTKPTVGCTRANTGWNIAPTKPPTPSTKALARSSIPPSPPFTPRCPLSARTRSNHCCIASWGWPSMLRPTGARRSRSSPLPCLHRASDCPSTSTTIWARSASGRDHPPHDRRGYLAMLRELADDEYAIVHLPNGVGQIPVQIQRIDQEIEKLL